MKPQSTDSFEDLLKGKLDNFSVEPPANLWPKIERESSPLKQRFLAKKLNTNLHWLNLAATFLLLIVALFFWFQPRLDNDNLGIPKFQTPLDSKLKGIRDSIDSLKHSWQQHKNQPSKLKPNHENQ
jgi:hypothetical protein